MKILLLDDDVQVLELLEMVLQEDGYQIQASLNSNEALALLQENFFDLIISDIHMPCPNGIDFGLQLRKFNSSIPIIYFSGEIDGLITYGPKIKKIGNATFVPDKNIKVLLNHVRDYFVR
ncbi:MAG TPA: response regulator [Bacteriovoracaceae bacterium]|nr:response regulator [Bacteriovoracaceae bacterium]